MQRTLDAAPWPGITARVPAVPPPQGWHIHRWDVHEPPPGCSVDLNLGGMVATVALAVICWPLFWIPMVVPGCKKRYQVPVFGPGPCPGAQQPYMTAAPPPPAALQQPLPQYQYANGVPVMGTPVNYPPSYPAPPHQQQAPEGYQAVPAWEQHHEVSKPWGPSK